MARRTRTTIAALTTLLACACSGGSEPASSPRAPEIDAGAVRAEQAWVGPAMRPEDIAALDDGRLAILASDGAAGAADVVLTSDDDGRTWEEHATGLGRGADEKDRDASADRDQPHLLAAGPVVLATRMAVPADVGGYQQVSVQQVVRSEDGGATWAPVELPLPGAGGVELATVRDAVGWDDTVVVVGRVERGLPALLGAGSSRMPQRDELDAAAWISHDRGRTFEPLLVPEIARGPAAQELFRVVRAGERLVATGTVVDGTTADDCCGTDASPLALALDLEPVEPSGWVATTSPSVPITGSDGGWWPYWTLRAADEVAEVGTPLARSTLTAGDTAWEQQEVPGADLAPGGGVGGIRDLRSSVDVDGGTALTWVEDSACDCSVAMAGRLDGSTLTPTELEFECRDESLRGDTRVGDPVRLDAAVVAPASCDHRTAQAAALAVSGDGGTTWTTHRLRALHAPTHDDLVVPFGRRHVASGRDSLVLVLEARNDGAPGYYGSDAGDGDPTPFVVVRVTAA